MEPFGSTTTASTNASETAPVAVTTDKGKPEGGTFGLIVLLGVLLVPAFLIGSGSNTAAAIAAGQFMNARYVRA